MRRKIWWTLVVAALAVIVTGRFAVSGLWPLHSPDGFTTQVPERWRETPGAPVETVLVTPGAQLTLWAQDLTGQNAADAGAGGCACCWRPRRAPLLTC